MDKTKRIQELQDEIKEIKFPPRPEMNLDANLSKEQKEEQLRLSKEWYERHEITSKILDEKLDELENLLKEDA